MIVLSEMRNDMSKEQPTIEQAVSNFTLASLKLSATRREATEFFQNRVTARMILNFTKRRVEPVIDPDQQEISNRLQSDFRAWLIAFSEMTALLGFEAEAASVMRYMIMMADENNPSETQEET